MGTLVGGTSNYPLMVVMKGLEDWVIEGIENTPIIFLFEGFFKASVITIAGVINIYEKSEAFGIGDVPVHRMLEFRQKVCFFESQKVIIWLVTVLFLVYGRYGLSSPFQKSEAHTWPPETKTMIWLET